jgi:hypothetical protein
MGMFDYFRSSYNLGEQFTNVVCQTKDIEEGLGGTMTDYWLDPAGQLWCPSYIGCSTMEIYEEGHPNYKPERAWMNWDWIPTGQHGKYQPHLITKYVEVYPEQWKGKWEDWPRLRLHFKHGKLQDYENITRND